MADSALTAGLSIVVSTSEGRKDVLGFPVIGGPHRPPEVMRQCGRPALLCGHRHQAMS